MQRQGFVAALSLGSALKIPRRASRAEGIFIFFVVCDRRRRRRRCRRLRSRRRRYRVICGGHRRHRARERCGADYHVERRRAARRVPRQRRQLWLHRLL